ncbi:SMI1/KNR4 family protein [Trinickia terrae]|uniref:SMI1/KNR4 family protein n=1 Tax=Trinickia terrae TaxID=2571161 RepID=A0A4U1I742_9BURK|nr:SMI1/KNR4 family protein [Trinickia terrae]TKC89209.1 SMI1/KNR4 family protein [Trinickia terrae]
MYENEFANGGPQVSMDDLQHAEADMGVQLPQDFKDYLLFANGGVPSKAYWPIDGGEYLWVKRFLSLKDSLGRGRPIEETYALGLQKAFLSPNLIPFAIDHGGNYFCLDRDGVYFYVVDAWRAEVGFEENARHAKRHLTDGIRSFINGLEEDGY